VLNDPHVLISEVLEEAPDTTFPLNVFNCLYGWFLVYLTKLLQLHGLYNVRWNGRK